MLIRHVQMCYKKNSLSGTIQLADLPGRMEVVSLTNKKLTADPMHGHLLRQTSTQSLGKPGATRYYWDPPGWHRVSARACIIHHCCGIPASVAAKKQKLSPQSARMRAVRAINLIALLLRAGDVHPNPGPSLHVAQFNVLGFSPGKKISLLHKAKMLALDVVLLQELHVTEDEASRLAIPGFHCFAVARDAKGGGARDLVKFLSRSIAKATAEVVPKGASHIPISWSAALEDATRKCERLLSPLEGATPTQRRQLLAATQERKNLLDLHCKKEWGKMCADMKPANSTTWKTLQNIVSARPTPTNLVVEGGREVPLTIAANHLVSFFKKKAVKHPEAKEPQAAPRPTIMFRTITRQELVDALRHIKCHRACGPDDVYNEALLQLPRAARTALLRTFNWSLSRGIVPHEWKRGTIVPFLKPGKPAGKVESYRPITLTSTIAKLMERIIHGRLRHLVTSENQAGFRAGMSATDVLMWLRAQVQPTSASKTPRASAVSVDFSRAFD